MDVLIVDFNQELNKPPKLKKENLLKEQDFNQELKDNVTKVMVKEPKLHKDKKVKQLNVLAVDLVKVLGLKE